MVGPGTRGRRAISLIADIGVSLVGFIVLIASIGDLGLVGGSKAQYSPLVTLAGAMLVAAPVIGAWVRWRSDLVRPAAIVVASAFGVATVVAVLSGSLALGALGWFVGSLTLLALLDQ